jgi:hypothetical protein
MGESSEIIIYQTVDGLTKIDVRMEGETLWLTQAQIAQLFGRDRSVITKHIRNLIAEGELDIESNVQNLHIAHSDKPVAFYSLDVILAVGYRVKSPRGTQFRQWATTVLSADFSAPCVVRVGSCWFVVKIFEKGLFMDRLLTGC